MTTKQNITADLASLYGVDANGKIISLTIDTVNTTYPVANATHAVQASVAETVTTAAQPNITSLGTLTSLTAGDVTVTGNLLVQGNTVTVGATELSVSDLNITVANGAPNAVAANGAGITIDGAHLTLTYDSTSNALVSSHDVSAPNVSGAYLNGTHVGGGQELVFNEDTVPLVKGDVVRVSGAQGNTIAVRKASNSAEGSSAGTLGIVTQTIAVGATGLVHTHGSFAKLDTSALAEGALVFLGVGGTWTTTKPQAPAHTVILGWVERIHATVGSIYVKVDNGYELDELHNVKITTPTAGQFLAYDSANSVWVNQTVAQYSPKKYSKEYHVDPANGDDTAAGGSETPFKTITAALTHVTNGGDALILHPGTYSEAVTVTTLNLDIIGRTGGGGIVNLSGAWTYNVASGSIRVEGVNHSGAVTISNAGSFYARKCLFTGGITKGGSGYVDITDSDAQSANALTITGSGIVAFNGGLQAALVVNNASATVTVANSKNLTSATVTNGTLVVNDSYIFSASNTVAAITSAVGTVVYLQNSRIVKPNQSAGFVTLAGVFSMSNMSYDHANSTLGTRLATVSYSDALNVAGNITLAATGSNVVVSTSNITVANGRVQVSNDTAAPLVGSRYQESAQRSILTSYGARGTRAAPNALQSGDFIGGMAFIPWVGNALGNANFTADGLTGGWVTSSFAPTLNAVLVNPPDVQGNLANTALQTTATRTDGGTRLMRHDHNGNLTLAGGTSGGLRWTSNNANIGGTTQSNIVLSTGNIAMSAVASTTDSSNTSNTIVYSTYSFGNVANVTFANTYTTANTLNYTTTKLFQLGDSTQIKYANVARVNTANLSNAYYPLVLDSQGVVSIGANATGGVSEATYQAYVNTTANTIANLLPTATFNAHVSDQANTVANLVTTTTYQTYVDTTANTIANLATQTYVNGAIANLVGSAPDALNTLSEIANALGSDANLSTTLTASIGNTNSNVANLANTVSTLTTDTANSFTSTNSNVANLANTVSTLTTDTANSFTLVNGNVSNLSNTTTASFTSTNSNVANLANTVSNLSNTTTASFTSTNGNVANLITENNATHTAIRNRILLSGGFLLTEGTAVGNRTPYTGSLIGETSTSYWFDSGDDKWYDASTGGNVLIGY